MVKIGLIYKQLTKRDLKVLEAIEKGHSKYEYVPLEIIEKYSKLPEQHVLLSLSKMHRLKLVKRKMISGYKAFRLTYLGLDMLALDYFVRKDIVEAIGDRIGVGKESELYKALAPGGKKVAIKFLRIGRTSFRKTRIVRTWAQDPRIDWFKQSKIAAEREFKALKELYQIGTYVPYVLAYNRHAVVIEYIEGVELYRKPELDKPEEVLWKILDTLRKAYLEVGVVHGDLSEYNVIVNVDTNTPYIIDWPQYVYKDDPSAEQLLKRDVEYIVRFFNKNYKVGISPDKALKYVRGENE
ncbi:MAG: phosphotransferase [Staphylothermus sp.]|nr:phosphotransferase [Staphylothermus sp.]